MYDTVLVPVDGSDQSTEAADHALEIARRFGSQLHLLYVISDRGSERMSKAVSELSEGATERQERQRRREAAGDELLDAVAERAVESDLAVERPVLQGDPTDEITTYTTDHGIDLVVLGACGEDRETRHHARHAGPRRRRVSDSRWVGETEGTIHPV